MMLFDFFKKFFGWADESGRKRRANDSTSSHEEFLQIKRHKCDHETGRLSPSFDESRYRLDDDDDHDDDDYVKITESACRATYAKKLPNGFNDENSQSFARAKSTPEMNQRKKCGAATRRQRNESDAENLADNAKSGGCVFSDSRCSTLAKTYRLNEKKQYGEMLRNFVPRRIQELNGNGDQSRNSKRVTEVIDLEKYEPRPDPVLGSSNGASICPASSRWLQRPMFKSRIPSSGMTMMNESDKKDKEFLDRKANDREEASSSSSCSSKTAQRSFDAAKTMSNSLRDRLASKAVMKTDYIPQVAKRYNVRIEECTKEAEELKKKTALLAKHNRLVREAALEEQLARSMRLCEAVLDEKEEPEEAPLPLLTTEMLQEIRQALVPHPHSQVLAEGFGLQITRKDIHTLAGLNWLNDEVINFYMNLLIVRGTGGDLPQVHVLNTFFYPKLLSGGHASLKRWTRKVDIFSKDLLVVPIHLGVHWCMSIVDFREKAIRYFDSMGGSNQKCLNALKQYLQDESLDKRGRPFDITGWKFENVKDIPQQMNGSDCGVFSCMFAEYICGNKRLTFSQKDMPYFRNKMVYEILHSKLL